MKKKKTLNGHLRLCSFERKFQKTKGKKNSGDARVSEQISLVFISFLLFSIEWLSSK